MLIPMAAAGLKSNGAALSLSFLQAATSASDATSYTFSSQSLGAADSTRTIVVAVALRALSTGAIASGVTVAGVTATHAVTITQQDTNANETAIYYAPVPTGTTGDVVVSCRSAIRCGIGMWRLVGATASVSATDSEESATPSLSVTVPSGGVAVASANGTWTASAPHSWTWSTMTEDFDQAPESANQHSGASYTSSGALTATPVPAGMNREIAVLVAFGGS